MPNARRERDLRRAVLELSKHGNEDVSDVLGRLTASQQDQLRGLLEELGGAKDYAPALHAQPTAQQPSMDVAVKAFLRRVPSPLAERLQTALSATGHSSAAPSASSVILPGMPRHLTERTASVLANAIAGRVMTPASPAEAGVRTKRRFPLLRRLVFRETS